MESLRLNKAKIIIIMIKIKKSIKLQFLKLLVVSRWISAAGKRP